MTREQEIEHQQEMARIESRKAAFLRTPFCFTIWDIMQKLLSVVFWLCFWALIAQCHCQCIIK